MKISEIKPYEKNAKKHPAKHIKQVAESFKRNCSCAVVWNYGAW